MLKEDSPVMSKSNRGAVAKGEAVPSPFLEVSNQDWINSEQLDLTMTLL